MATTITATINIPVSTGGSNPGNSPVTETFTIQNADGSSQTITVDPTRPSSIDDDLTQLVQEGRIPPSTKYLIESLMSLLPPPDSVAAETPPYKQMQDDLKTLFAKLEAGDMDPSALIALVQSDFMKAAISMRRFAKEQMWHAQDQVMGYAAQGAQETRLEADANYKHEQMGGIATMAGGALNLAGGIVSTHQVVKSVKLGKQAGHASDEVTRLRNEQTDAMDEFRSQQDRLRNGRNNKADNEALNKHLDEHKTVRKVRADLDNARHVVRQKQDRVKQLETEDAQLQADFKKMLDEVGPAPALERYGSRLKALPDAKKALVKAEKDVAEQTKRLDAVKADIAQSDFPNAMSATGKQNMKDLDAEIEATAKQAHDHTTGADAKLRMSQAITQLTQGVSGMGSGVVQTSGAGYVVEAGDHAADAKVDQGHQDVANVNVGLSKDSADNALQMFSAALQNQETTEQDKNRLRSSIASRI
jgi:hypothetical protein